MSNVAEVNEDTKCDQVALGGVVVEKVSAKVQRMSLLLWGTSGCGKTTLAATAPGKKLLINFDPDGPASIANRDDVDVVDFSGSKMMIVEKFKSDNPFGIQSVLSDYETVIVDSLTSVAQMALMHGISRTKGATIERPSPGAYMVRNALTLQLVMNLLRLTGREKKHIIFVAHEATPVTDDNGSAISITVMLGGQLPQQATLNFSECWNLSDTGKKRRLAVRNVRLRRPMKSRMFNSRSVCEFDWVYDAESLEGMTIEGWFNQWKDNEFNKIAIPS